MTEFFKTIAARHKWNTAFFLWSASWFVLSIMGGAYWLAALHLAFAAFFVWMSVWSEKQHRRHTARMQRVREADDIEALLRVINERY